MDILNFSVTLNNLRIISRNDEAVLAEIVLVDDASEEICSVVQWRMADGGFVIENMEVEEDLLDMYSEEDYNKTMRMLILIIKNLFLNDDVEMEFKIEYDEDMDDNTFDDLVLGGD